jgi:uncharacterized protein (DUF2235 family)
MTKNIVICSDGTNSTFDTNVSSVSRLVRLLALDDRHAQMVFYSQGVGTSTRHVAAVQAYRRSVPDTESIVALDDCEGQPFASANWLSRLAGLAGGLGVKAKVRAMYCELAQHYTTHDRIFLFGFSRGAFSVRVLAGLLHRCGLPQDAREAASAFDDAWRICGTLVEDRQSTASIRSRSGHRACAIHFVGLWDTVMSYGGVKQRTFLHLRNNPIVRHVRQALSLDEGRSWFQVRSWGQLDSDPPLLREPDSDRGVYALQDIMEVWFRGSHSDVGGSNARQTSMSLALRWMVCEAARYAIRLNEDGKSIATDSPKITAIYGSDLMSDFMTGKSSSGMWSLADLIPRWEIDNSGRWPKTKFTWGNTGRRWPNHFSRGGKILVCSADGATSMNSDGVN